MRVILGLISIRCKAFFNIVIDNLIYTIMDLLGKMKLGLKAEKWCGYGKEIRD
jgi:hypothetical protein